MKYISLQEFDEITNCLNFDTIDRHVVGGCELYTTKATRKDKKLYREIEDSLNTNYANMLSNLAQLPPQLAAQAGASFNLARASAFGPLSEKSNRKTFAYLIATMNASAPDHDYFNILWPIDFRQEKNVGRFMNMVDLTLSSVRPKYSSSLPNQAPHWSNEVVSTVPQTPHGSEKWNPRMWTLIDKEMVLKDCSIYYLKQGTEDGEGPSLETFRYFIYNRQKKRVCYFWLRVLSITSYYLPPLITPTKKKRPASGSWSLDGDSTKKKARYYLDDQAGQAEWDGEDYGYGGEEWEGNVEEVEIYDDDGWV